MTSPAVDLDEPATLARGVAHVRDTIAFAMDHADRARTMLVVDDFSELARTLGAVYRRALPTAEVVTYTPATAVELRLRLDSLNAGDLLILVQSSIFSLHGYRIRVEICKRHVKVIEHTNLARMRTEHVASYLESMAYDPAYYRGVGHALKAAVNAASNAVIHSGAPEPLHFDSPLEAAKINIGDFTELRNVGSQFPIGEVFTEARDLAAVHGAVRIYAFADLAFLIQVPRAPITLHIAAGHVVGTENSSQEFDAVLAGITEAEGCVWVRELGFGMNRAFGPHCIVPDIGAFERAIGVHLSLGAKHGVYKKPELSPKLAHHHVDVMVMTEAVTLGDRTVFRDGQWCLG